jgi:hypothetical protein
MFQNMAGFMGPGGGMYQQPQDSHQQNAYIINSHNCHKHIRDHLENFEINGHNNRIEVASTIETLKIQGHNNKTFASLTN